MLSFLGLSITIMYLIDIWRMICERVTVNKYLSVQHADTVEDADPGT